MTEIQLFVVVLFTSVYHQVVKEEINFVDILFNPSWNISLAILKCAIIINVK